MEAVMPLLGFVACVLIYTLLMLSIRRVAKTRATQVDVPSSEKYAATAKEMDESYSKCFQDCMVSLVQSGGIVSDSLRKSLDELHDNLRFAIVEYSLAEQSLLNDDRVATKPLVDKWREQKDDIISIIGPRYSK